jgi:hypothetical protein
MKGHMLSSRKQRPPFPSTEVNPPLADLAVTPAGQTTYVLTGPYKQRRIAYGSPKIV